MYIIIISVGGFVGQAICDGGQRAIVLNFHRFGDWGTERYGQSLCVFAPIIMEIEIKSLLSLCRIKESVTAAVPECSAAGNPNKNQFNLLTTHRHNDMTTGGAHEE